MSEQPQYDDMALWKSWLSDANLPAVCERIANRVHRQFGAFPTTDVVFEALLHGKPYKFRISIQIANDAGQFPSDIAGDQIRMEDKG